MNPFIRRILFASLVSGAALGTVPPVRTAPPSHAGPPPAAAAIAVTGLRCEYAVSPMGIDVPRPRLYWRVQSPERGARQTAWRVLVSSSPEFLAADRGDLWDSGRVASDESAHIPYAGSPLASSQRVYWKVRAWDQAGRPSAWSLPATWTMGLLRAEDWKGAWIAAPGETETLLLRGTFDVRPGLVRAVAHASGLGHYELTLNGRRVGEDLFAPGWTNYARTVLYDTHDVTALLTTGRNAAGFLLGNGMYHVVRRNRLPSSPGRSGRCAPSCTCASNTPTGRWSTPARTPAGGRIRARLRIRASMAARITTPAWSRAGGARPPSTTAGGAPSFPSSAWSTRCAA